MSRIAFIYPGQGAQACGMGQDFYEQSAAAREVFDLATEALGFSVPELCFEKNERLDITEFTQPAMVTTGIAMTRVLAGQGIRPEVTAGLSLGEYCALCTAGAMNARDAIAAVRQRGILMQEAVPVGVGGMTAVLAMEAAAVEEAIAGIPDVQIANYNCPGQIVISGKLEAVRAAEAALKAAGAKRLVPLKVSGPFHSALLKEAGTKLGKVLEGIAVSDPEIPYVANVTAEYVREASQVRLLLIRQVYSSVRWEQSVRTMLAAGIDTFVEIGPGRTLAGFMRKIDRNAKVCSIEKFTDIEKLMQILQTPR